MQQTKEDMDVKLTDKLDSGTDIGNLDSASKGGAKASRRERQLMK